METNTQLAIRLKESRKQAGLSMRQAVELSGCKHSEIGAWETSGQIPDDWLTRLAELYDVSEEWLRTGTNPDFNVADYQPLIDNNRFSMEETQDLLSLFESLRQEPPFYPGHIEDSPIDTPTKRGYKGAAE